MQINPQNHRNQKNELFGLLPMRLTYENAEVPKYRVPPEGHIVPDDAFETQQKKIDSIEAQRDAFRKEMIKAIKKYNKTTDPDYNSDRPFLRPLSLDVANPHAIITEIDSILTAPYLTEHGWFTLLKPAEDSEKSRGKELLAIRALLTNSDEIHTEGRPVKIDKKFIQQWNDWWPKAIGRHIPISRVFRERSTTFKPGKEALLTQYRRIAGSMEAKLLGYPFTTDKRSEELNKMLGQVKLQIALLESESDPSLQALAVVEGAYVEANDEALRLRAKRLLDRMHILGKQKEIKPIWEGKDSYKRIKRAFDKAKTDPDFAPLFNLSDGEISNPAKREMETLFMAIMRKNTNNFEASQNDYAAILGPEFGQNHRENIKKFPFIYNEWLKRKGVDTEGIRAEKAMVDAVESEIAASNTPSVETIISGIQQTGQADIGRNVAEYRKLNASLEANGDNRNIYAGMQEEIHTIYLHCDAAVSRIKRDKATEHQSFIKPLETFSKQLKKHERLMKANKLYFSKLKNKQGAELMFTRSGLNSEEDHQILVEISMKKLMKAKLLVDRPLNEGDSRDYYHATIRRMLITTAFREGVSDYRLDSNGKEKYVENLNEDNYWMLTEMAKSEYFNRVEIDKNIDAQHRKILLAARVANRVSINLGKYEDIKEVINTVIDIKEEENKSNPNQVKINKWIKGLRKFPAKLIRLYRQEDDINLLRAKLEEAEQDEIHFRGFLQDATDAIRLPYGPIDLSDKKKRRKLVPFFNKVAKDQYVWTNASGQQRRIISAKELETFNTDLQDNEFSYNILDSNHKSKMNVFRTLGIRIEGVRNAYLAGIKENPDMDVSKWTGYVTGDRANFMKLKDFLGDLLSTSDSGIKDDFLAVFETLHGYKGPLNDPNQSMDEQAAALTIFGMIKLEIESRELKAGQIGLAEAELKAKIEGTTIGDKIEEYGRGVWDMIFGSGQNITTRLAGGVIALGILKAARKAWKGDDKWGKMFRGVFIGISAELAMKHITGEGWLEKYLGLGTVAEAASGSYKAAQMEHASSYMSNREGYRKIESHEHAAALYELDKVSFKDILAWYNSSEVNKEDGSVEGGDNKLFDKLNIDTSKISKGTTWDSVDHEMRARMIVMHTVRQFFTYVGKKEQAPNFEDGGKFALEERWGKMVEDPDYKPQHTKFSLPPAYLRALRENPKLITWKEVMETETDLEDAEETKNKYGIDPYTEYISGAFNGFRKWTREMLDGKLYGHALKFFDNLGDKADQVKGFLTEVGATTGRNLEFAQDELSFMWEGNKYKIRRFFGMHWELIKTGVKLPFKIIYAADQVIVPWTLDKLRQIDAIAERTDFHPIQRDLSMGDIVSDARILGTADQLDRETNKEFAYYGFYQNAFTDAYLKGVLKEAAKQSGSAAINLDNASPEGKKRVIAALKNFRFPEGTKIDMYNTEAGAGYYISETTLEDIGAGSAPSSYDENAIFNLMNKESHEQAATRFLRENPDLTQKDIEEFMYPIHYIKKTSKPQKMYTFWRMPLPGSVELELKRMNKWADSYNPNAMKNRPPFMVDPQKSFLDNMEEAFAKSIDPDTRVVAGNVAALAAQIPRLAFGTLQAIGTIIRGSNEKNKGWTKGWAKKTEWIHDVTNRNPSTEQAIDEVSTAAGGSWAMSPFYKKKANRDSYQCLLDFARHKRQFLYTDILQEYGGYESTWYVDEKPQDFTYGGEDGLAAYYLKWSKKNKKIPEFAKALKKKIIEEKRGN